jgi:hypothetical protein
LLFVYSHSALQLLLHTVRIHQKVRFLPVNIHTGFQYRIPLQAAEPPFAG